MADPDRIHEPRTINIEPEWEGMRRWVIHVARSDLKLARKIAEAMGSEAPADESLVAAREDTKRQAAEGAAAYRRNLQATDLGG